MAALTIARNQKDMANYIRSLGARFMVAAALLLAVGVSSVSAETLLMPPRDARASVPVVVWGVHTQAAGTVCSLNFGDLTALQDCTGADRSYIAYAHTYASQGTYTVTLTVGLETTTTTVQVFIPALLPGGATGDNNRSLGINMAIQDGLRFLWTNQQSRAANFPANTQTSWNNSGFSYADTSLVVLAFENQGYKIQANVPPTGIYEKYIVRRGLNFVIANLGSVALGVTPAGNDPCVAVPAPLCTGYAPPGDTGYTTALAILSLAGSGALPQVNNEVAGITAGKTYGEIAQRLVNALAWGQNDQNTGRGGWSYNFNDPFTSDGSTLGWDVLALADAQAAGLTVPAWVKTEFALVLAVPGGGQINSDGSFDYNANGALTDNSVGPQKNGIGLQSLFLIGEFAGARVTAVTDNINSWWPGGAQIGGNSWGGCPTIMGVAGNIGCAYGMFNNFKGLKLHGIATLPQVNRSTHAWAFMGSGAEDDWYADYQDWFVANQTSPGTTAGRTWGPAMGFSCCTSGDALETAIAELILSPVALVAPDPIKFATVGLSPSVASNPVGTDHTVTGLASAANDAPIAGVTIDFRVIAGPNVGKSGSGTTGADGKTTFTYHDDGGAGTDTIQAFIGATLSSNQVIKIWGLDCDVNGDAKVSPADLLAIRAKNNTVASGPADPFDPNHDGVINIADVRFCQLRLTASAP